MVWCASVFRVRLIRRFRANDGGKHRFDKKKKRSIVKINTRGIILNTIRLCNKFVLALKFLKYYTKCNEQYHDPFTLNNET